jgi:hypothetical protein
MDTSSSLRALVYAGGIVVRGAKIHAMLRLRDTRAVHDASSDACVRREARADWLSYEASVLSATGAQVVVAARSHERAPRIPSAISRSAREGKWVYTADAVVLKISGSLTLDAADIGSSIESVIAAQRIPVEVATRGGAFTRLEAAMVAIFSACAPSVAKEIAALRIHEIHAAIVDQKNKHASGANTYDLADACSALMVAQAAERDGTGGLRRLHADAACLLHAAGLSDQVGTVLNRIGVAEFDVYASALAASAK